MDINDLSHDLRRELEALIAPLQASLATVIRETDQRIALPPGAEAALAGLRESLPETGCGAAATIERLLELANAAPGRGGAGGRALPHRHLEARAPVFRSAFSNWRTRP